MSASVDVVTGDVADGEQLAAALAGAGVVYGVDAEACHALSDALADPGFTVEAARVASGAPALVGSDGYFSPAFEPGITPGHIGDDGKMDFRDRDLLKPVQAQDPLGFVHAAIAGVPGRRVDGGVLAVPAVREASLVLGPGVARAADGQLLAAVDGVILYVPHEKLDVVRQHRHRGDVDLRSGHLEMAGSLSVSGDVQRLFYVRASGDVEIAGSVCGGSVQAGGSISVRGSVQGGAEGALSARADVRLRSAERAQIRAGGLLKLDSAVHCLLEASQIEVAILRGGEAHAERSVVVKEAGFANGADTSIEAGEPLELVRDELRASISSARGERWRQRARGGGESAERARGGKAGRARPSLQREDLERLIALRAMREELLKGAHVLVQKVAYPGLTIQLGDARITLTEQAPPMRFAYDASTRSIRSERFVP